MAHENDKEAGPGPVSPNPGTPEAQPLYRRIKWPFLLYMLELALMYRFTGWTFDYIYTPGIKDPMIIMLMWLAYVTVGSDCLTNLMKIYYGVQDKTQVDLKRVVLEVRVLWLIIVLLSNGPYIWAILSGQWCSTCP